MSGFLPAYSIVNRCGLVARRGRTMHAARQPIGTDCRGVLQLGDVRNPSYRYSWYCAATALTAGSQLIFCRPLRAVPARCWQYIALRTST